MAACDVLYFDPAQAGRGAGNGWRPCSASGQVWTDPELVLRFICTQHRRQVAALHAAGLANQVRWNRSGLPTGPAPSTPGEEEP